MPNLQLQTTFFQVRRLYGSDQIKGPGTRHSKCVLRSGWPQLEYDGALMSQPTIANSSPWSPALPSASQSPVIFGCQMGQNQRAGALAAA
jgi:hypothetical protein